MKRGQANWIERCPKERYSPLTPMKSKIKTTIIEVYFYLILSGFSLLPVQAELIPLFDGKSIDGWDGNKSVWRVENGILIGGSFDGNPKNEYLATKNEFQNFRLKLEFKLEGSEGFINGGVQFRSQWLDDSTNMMSGYQADIGHGYTGFLYDEHRRNRFLTEADNVLIAGVENQDDWNTYEIVANGDLIQLYVNGVKSIHFVERDNSIPQSGVIALQIHGDCKAQISFRNILIEELDELVIPEEPEVMNRFGKSQPSLPVAPFDDKNFKLQNNDVIVLVGQENFVREQRNGILEAYLYANHTSQNIAVRPMAWEADTVYEQWRDLHFGDWDAQLEAAGCTVLMAQFGQMESLDGIIKLPDFISAYHRLLDKFSARTEKIILISPIPFETPEAPHAPDLSIRNQDLSVYVDAIKKIAEQRDLIFIDIFYPLLEKNKDIRLTQNGIHLNTNGLDVVGRLIAQELGLKGLSSEIMDRIRPAIIQKNQIWFDCWRPANWSFVYGDRINQRFGKASGKTPSLQIALENQLPLVLEADKRIHQLVSHTKVAPLELPENEEKPSPISLTPNEQLNTFQVADGFEIDLYASEKNGVINPVQIAWDDRGRLYVACSPSYPQTLASAVPSDFILVLEDSDKDGVIDKSWKFAGKLTMVQGVEPSPEGVYVCDFDKLLLLKDSDGDGKADQRHILFSGFGIGDTHQLINSISHGIDGSLWFTQGLHAMSRVETPWGIARLDRSAVWRLSSKSLRLEGFFGGGMAGMNCWGVAIDDYGQVFHKSGDRPHGYWTVPGMVRGASPSHTSDDKFSNASYKVTPDQYHPVGPLFETSPKTTSLDFIGTQAMPSELQGTALIAGYFGSVVEIHRLHDQGAGFRSTQLPKLVRSSNNSFRPVDVSVGPDGALYVADWFNPVIGHYQASYADSRRDKTHGRIWRISATGFPSIKQPDFSSMSNKQLLGLLNSSERWTRYQAKKVLFYRPTRSVIESLDQWLQDGDYSEKHLLEVCGIYEAHHTAKSEIVEKLIASKDFRIRSYGIRMVGMWGSSLSKAYAILKKGAQDSHPRVRLEAVVAATYLEYGKAVEITVAALEKESDPFLNYAIRQSSKALIHRWAEPFSNGELELASKNQSEYLLGLLDAEPKMKSEGESLYQKSCLPCHQPGGVGLPGVYPALVGSKWVQSENKSDLIKIVLNGLEGSQISQTKDFGNQSNRVPMPPMNGLSDLQISQVLSYIRQSFGKGSSEVSQQEVAKIRALTNSRKSPWTISELEKKPD